MLISFTMKTAVAEGMRVLQQWLVLFSAVPCLNLVLLQGIFRGYDQVTNVILENCCELVFSTSVSAAAAVVVGSTTCTVNVAAGKQTAVAFPAAHQVTVYCRPAVPCCVNA